jgi:hypothetical protein
MENVAIKALFLFRIECFELDRDPGQTLERTALTHEKDSCELTLQAWQLP